ncbi:hypothetical protein HRI_001021800 [Hibiscus trionum]|uniref:Reverse transcriptase domain-containing protein n=1 Tax=Hibiscus trionum TaxID=183268 RepID=A0A9W7HCY3_HIBTR|nr:hypothetical protein HRI_001021800 [Hibiscus trionum]
MEWSIITWNIRGLGRAEKIRAVRSLFVRKKPKLLFIQETKVKDFSLSMFRRLGINQNFEKIFVPSNGSSGGIFSVWEADFLKVSQVFTFTRFIVVLGIVKGYQHNCGFLNVYGLAVEADREGFFADLLAFINSHEAIWCIGGDFNAYLGAEEKIGFSANSHTINLFRSFIQDAALVDLPMNGGTFTWSNNRDPPTFIRLDRFLVDRQLLTFFPNTQQILLSKSISDHNPVCLENVKAPAHARPFKLFNYMMGEDGFKSLVENAFSKGKSNRGLFASLKELKKSIKQWSAVKPVDVRNQIQILEAQIDSEEKNIQHGIASSELPELRKKLWACLRKEESIWLQNSRLKWFKEGDRNTHYFHMVASNRRRHNAINSLVIEDQATSDQEEIRKGFYDHFYKVYNQSNTLPIDEIKLSFAKLSIEQCMSMENEFTEEEVWAAIDSTDSSRAPGPDGYSMGFFKKFWHILKEDLLKVFRDFYAHRKWDSRINHSFISLIPKKLGPICPEDFRPISLVGGIYKIISKVLSRRLSPCMDTVVSKQQFAFIPGRSILECSLIANEGIDYIRKKGLKGSIFKFDFKGAYDSVDWNFLIRVLREMGFGDRWCKWIHHCVSSASISVLVNGIPTPQFSVTRGLRQGCPLSPLLFNLIGEALHLMLEKATSIGLFRGFIMGTEENSFQLSHFQYADDLIIFCTPNIGEIRNVKRILRIFELAAGLQLNLSKSRLFGINVEESVVAMWAASIGCMSAQLPSQYLGLPLGAKRNSLSLWEPVVEKFYTTLASWKSNCLSFSGRLVLIKSVLAALPLYYLSIFKMPVAIANKLNSLMANFLWGSSESRKAIHWLKWSGLCQPINCGGLGIRDLRIQNQALLGKWVWNFVTEKDSIWKTILCSKMNCDNKSTAAVNSSNRYSSWMWRDIAKSFSCKNARGMSLVDKLILHLGDGSSIKFWLDHWIGEAPLQHAFPRIYALSNNKEGTVSEFGQKIGSVWIWNITLRRGLFDWECHQWEALMACLNSFSDKGFNSDRFTWQGSSEGIYTAKGGYNCLTQQTNSSPFWKKLIWNNKVPSRVSFFVWQASHHKIPVRALLIKRGIPANIDTCCPLCRATLETPTHLLLHCRVSWLLWTFFAAMWKINLVMPDNVVSIIMLLDGFFQSKHRGSIGTIVLAAILWTIWLQRNDLVFREGSLDFMKLCFVAKFRLVSWFKAANEDCVVPFDAIMADPTIGENGGCSKKTIPKCSGWLPPPQGFVTINTDGATSRERLSGGIGGLARNSEGKCLFSFSESVGRGPPILTELLAMKMGLQKFHANPLCRTYRAIVESDSEIAINWVMNPGTCPTTFSDLVSSIVLLGEAVGCIFKVIPRASNIEADNLAKAGIG